MSRFAALLVLVLGSLPVIVLAGASSARAEGFRIDSARFAIGWANPEALEWTGHPEADGTLVGGEALFTMPPLPPTGSGFLDRLLSPLLHVGGMVNLENDHTSYVYAGYTWRYDITERLFWETSLGLSANNGDDCCPAVRARLGSHVLFREAVAIGFRFTPSASVVFQAEHMSHARLFDDLNRGLSHLSVKFALDF